MNARFAYLDVEPPAGEVQAILGAMPKRWGRMDRLSRLAVVEVGRALVAAGLLGSDRKLRAATGRAGLVAASRRGSLTTDLAYAATLAQGPTMASPLLFGYTLANIALAEAASHFGLRGPVYALYGAEPLASARREAQRWLATDRHLGLMVAGEFDFYPGSDGPVALADFAILPTFNIS